MKYLTVREVLVIYAEISQVSAIERRVVRNLGGLESALAQPQQTFDGADLYPTIEEKAAALLYSLCQNHPFLDGNKRLAYTATCVFLRMNGHDLNASQPDAHDFMYAVAQGEVATDKVAVWIAQRIHAL